MEANLNNSDIKEMTATYKKKKERKKFIKGILFILPSLGLFIIFTFYPFLRNIVQSFYLSDTTGGLSLFVGLDNYIALFQNNVFQTSIKNTLIYTIVTVPITIIISLMLAVMSNVKLKGMRFYQICFTLTMGISVAAGSVFFSFLYHPSAGILNKIMTFFGLDTVGFLTDPNIALFSVAAVSIWMNIGFCYLILNGGLKSIDSSFYESGDIVGAGFWYSLRKITIPLLSPSLFFVFTISLINSFQTFGVIDMLTRGGPNNASNLLVYNLYQDAFVNFQYGSAAAQGVVLFIIIFIISRIQARLTERLVTYQ